MTNDYIRREDAVDELQVKVFHDLTDEYYGTMQVLDELPAADVVPVVRCDDCVYSVSKVFIKSLTISESIEPETSITR